MRLLPTLAPLALAACMGGSPAPQPAANGATALPQGEADTCNAAAFSGLIGQPEAAVDAAPIFQPIRKIRPGGAVTTDFNPERLNFELDGGGRVRAISCG